MPQTPGHAAAKRCYGWAWKRYHFAESVRAPGGRRLSGETYGSHGNGRIAACGRGYPLPHGAPRAYKVQSLRMFPMARTCPRRAARAKRGRDAIPLRAESKTAQTPPLAQKARLLCRPCRKRAEPYTNVRAARFRQGFTQPNLLCMSYPAACRRLSTVRGGGRQARPPKAHFTWTAYVISAVPSSTGARYKASGMVSIYG